MLYALDIETTGTDRFVDTISVIGVFNPKTGYRGFTTVDEFSRALKNDLRDAAFICHNGSFDVNFLRHFGVDIRSQYAYDTRSIASILIPSPQIAEGQSYALGLENLHIQYLGGKAYKLDRENMSSYTIDEIVAYNAKDCEITFNLFKKFVSIIPTKHWEFVEKWLMPATHFCADLEYNGIYGDWRGLGLYKDEVQKIRDRVLDELNKCTEEPRRFFLESREKVVQASYAVLLEAAINRLKSPTDEKITKTRERYKELCEKALAKIEPFNWNSSDQLKWLLRDFYNLSLLNKRTGKETTDEEKLKQLEHPTAKKLLEYREVEKLLNQQFPSLLNNIKADDCVHATWKIGGTRTGRLSCSEPNLQQISARKPIGKRIRSFIQARPGNLLLTVDFAQIEPRLIAHCSGEEKLIKAFEDKIDIYSVFAKEIFQITDCDLREFKAKRPTERACGKTGGLSVLYGTGPRKFAEMVRKDTGVHIPEKKAKVLIDQFRNNLPAVGEFKQFLERKMANGRAYANLLGRPIYIENNDDLYMQALNTYIQGSASDLVIDSQINGVRNILISNHVTFVYRLLVHDEVVIELPASEAEDIASRLIIPAMTKELKERHQLIVPLEVEYTINRSWEKS